MSNSSSRTEKGCRGCPAICCHNLSMIIGRPENKEEIEDLKWQLRFDSVRVYIRHRRWHQLVDGRCMYLNDENLCEIYEERPDKCRDHNPPDCERFGDYFDVMINTPEELDAYLSRKKRKK